MASDAFIPQHVVRAQWVGEADIEDHLRVPLVSLILVFSKTSLFSANVVGGLRFGLGGRCGVTCGG